MAKARPRPAADSLDALLDRLMASSNPKIRAWARELAAGDGGPAQRRRKAAAGRGPAV